MVNRIVLVTRSGIRRRAEVTISLLSTQKGVTELVVVVEPALTTLINGGLTHVVVFVKVTGSSVVTYLGVAVDVVHSLSSCSIARPLVLLEAEHSGSCEGKVPAAYRTRSGISESAIAVLATLTVCESPADALWHVPEVETSVVTSFESLHLPCGDRHISSPPTFVKVIVPSSGRVLIINDPLYSQLDRFLQVGNIESENSTEHVGFSESIG